MFSNGSSVAPVCLCVCFLCTKVACIIFTKAWITAFKNVALKIGSDGKIQINSENTDRQKICESHCNYGRVKHDVKAVGRMSAAKY